ncbi:hypothetical protein CDQ71_02220 [Campylobacter hyointestinalis subsp. hyointestinalis]|nr:hypothetical protein CDQ71_02220 [Campylobacter hyointestinalis subsp. hyointestinalis]PPB69425.1 hypothetical protein CDQ76_01905 [Campylobacter hyointestinalis subsp. hyointestinalis]
MDFKKGFKMLKKKDKTYPSFKETAQMFKKNSRNVGLADIIIQIAKKETPEKYISYVHKKYKININDLK